MLTCMPQGPLVAEKTQFHVGKSGGDSLWGKAVPELG